MEESRKNRIVITIGLIGLVTLLAFQNCSQAKIDAEETISEESAILNMNEASPGADPE